MAAGRNEQLGYTAAELVAELFRRLGYGVKRSVPVAGMVVDLVIERDGLRSPVELIAPTSGLVPLDKLRDVASRLLTLQAIKEGLVGPVIVIVGDATTAAKHFAEERFNLRIWDLDVLRGEDTALRRSLSKSHDSCGRRGGGTSERNGNATGSD